MFGRCETHGFHLGSQCKSCVEDTATPVPRNSQILAKQQEILATTQARQMAMSSPSISDDWEDLGPEFNALQEEAKRQRLAEQQRTLRRLRQNCKADRENRERREATTGQVRRNNEDSKRSMATSSRSNNTDEVDRAMRKRFFEGVGSTCGGARGAFDKDFRDA